MKPGNRSFVFFLLLVLAATSAFGQTTAQVNGSRGPVEVLEQNGSISSIQTGANASTTLTIGSEISVSIGEQTLVEIHKLGISPVLWVDHGNIQVSSKSSEIQVQAKSGWFTASEWPFEMALSVDKGPTGVVLTAGAVKTQNLDFAGVSFRAAGNTGVRTFSAGGRQHDTPATNAPPVYIQPVVTFGGPTTPQAPAAPSTPAVKVPTTPKPPTPRN